MAAEHGSDTMKADPDSVAGLVARLLKRRGTRRVFALCGGHIMPIWMRLDAEGIPAFALDGNSSIADGSYLFIPVRVMVDEDDADDARRIVAEAASI